MSGRGWLGCQGGCERGSGKATCPVSSSLSGTPPANDVHMMPRQSVSFVFSAGGRMDVSDVFTASLCITKATTSTLAARPAQSQGDVHQQDGHSRMEIYARKKLTKADYGHFVTAAGRRRA